MEEPINLFVLGTAGCGKSTLVAAYADWMYRNQYSTTLVNLDPGVETLPYEPDVDVRDLFTLSEVMEDYSLGPNGAQIVAADMLALNTKKLKDDISSKESHYVIYDTPGQLELFTFREASKELMNGLYPKRSAMIYLIDPFNARTPSGFISQLMLSSLCKLRFQIPSMDIISKLDMITFEDEERLKGWIDYPERLLDDAFAESTETGSLNVELNIGIHRALDDMGQFGNIRKASSVTQQGMEDIYTFVQMALGAGEDLEKI